MKDIFGQIIEIGDTVAFNQPNYKNLIFGKVLKINPKSLRISYFYHGQTHETNEYPKNTVKKTNNEN